MRSTARRQEDLVEDVVRRASSKPSPRSQADKLDVGARLLEIRKERSLSLQDVSRMTGVSASACSKIERNELSPTISTMQRIAEGLDVELAALLTGSVGSAGAVSGRRSVTRAGQGSRHVTGTCDNALLCADLKDKRITPILTTVRARSTDEYGAWSRSDADIFLTVLKGELVVHSAVYEPLTLKAGDSVYYSAEAEHVWTSLGAEDAVVLWMIASEALPR